MKGRGTNAVAWLESPEGEAWSRSRHAPISLPLIMVKNDDPGEDEWAAFVWYISLRPRHEAISRGNCA